MLSKDTEMKSLKFIKHISACLSIMLAFSVNIHATTGDTFTGDGSRKRERSVENISPYDSSDQEMPITLQPKQSTIQTYGIATYDALFKWVLSDETLLPSFFHAFIPGVVVESAERLDEHMNPVQKLQLLRDFIHDDETYRTVKEVLKTDNMHVSLIDKKTKTFLKDDKATAFLRKFTEHFDELKSAFPPPKYDGTMDFVCRLKNGEYAMIEMQVIPQDCWDRRALAYAGAFYGNQLAKGESWKQIKRVIAINILGGGREYLPHWKDTPNEFFRHYRFQEQCHKPSRYIDGIELFQYSIMNAPKNIDKQEQQDWITFFKRGHYMSEKEVLETIKTPAVLTAFERARIDKLPRNVQRGYEAEDSEYSRFSEHTASEVAKAKIESKIEVVKRMLSKNKTINDIVDATDLTLEQIEKIRDGIKSETE